MSLQREQDRAALQLLFERFVKSGLTGDLDTFIGLFEDPYTGVGLGEQGLVTSIAEVDRIMRASYKPGDGKGELGIEISELMINFLHDDVAVVSAAICVTILGENGSPMRSGLMQTVAARRTQERWVVGFTHASTTMVNKDSIEVYPIQFMDHTLSRLRAELQPDLLLYAEVNLMQNTVQQLEGPRAKALAPEKFPQTLEALAECGLCGEVEEAALAEYFSFFHRLRLLGLLAEGVDTDQFLYQEIQGKKRTWVQVSVTMMRQPFSGDGSAVIAFTEMTDHKGELAQLTHKASHDALTGVLNREGFESQAAALLEAYDPRDSTMLFMVDLDDFKQVNDRLGHQVGDTMLRQVAGVLQEVFGNESAVGRIGGDEFMVLLTGPHTLVWAEQHANRLLSAMRLRMGESGQVAVSVSIGISFAQARATFEKLYRIADIALYTAKRAGKGRFHMINADTSCEHPHTEGTAALLTLQTLLNYTEDRQVEQKRTPYEALVENIPGEVLVISVGKTVKMTPCNDWFERNFGFSSSDLDEMQHGDEPFFLIHPEDVPQMTQSVTEMYAGRQKVSIAFRLRRRDGSYRPVYLSMSLTERSQEESLYYGILTEMDTI